MKQKILAVFMACAAMLLSVSVVHAAQPSITATHSIVSQQAVANGDQLTLQLTVTNQGLQAIQTLTLEPADTMFMPDSNPIVLGNIPSGGSVSVLVSGTSPRYSISMPWMLTASGSDASGTQISVQIVSQGK